jgi:anti-anti-sigma factor
MTEMLAGSRGSQTLSCFRMIMAAQALGLDMLGGVRRGALVMGGALTITVRSERGAVIAAVTGEIDISTVPQLRERLFELADNGGTLIVDLNRVTFIDSAGLGALVGTARRAAAHGGSLPRSAPGRRPANCCG